MKKYEWRDRFEDGTARRVRAVHHGGKWTVHEQAVLPRSRIADDPRSAWTRLDPVPPPDLYELRGHLWRRYQRRRATHEEIVAIDTMIEDAGGEIVGEGGRIAEESPRKKR